MAILAAEQKAGALGGRRNGANQSRRRAEQHLETQLTGALHASRQIFGAGLPIAEEAVHFPITGDQWCAHLRHGGLRWHEDNRARSIA